MKQKFTKVKSQSISKSENKINFNETALDSAKLQGTISSNFAMIQKFTKVKSR